MKALVDKTPEWDIPLTMKIKHFKVAPTSPELSVRTIIIE